MAKKPADTSTAPLIIHELVAMFAEHQEVYKRGDYNETQLQRDFLDPFFAANAENFPGRCAEGDNSGGRYGFKGEPASEELRRRYEGKRVPDSYRKRGAANPIKYTW